MGKRKSSSKPAPKGKKDTLSTTFKCLFCNHDKTVSVHLDKKDSMFGTLRCKDCGQKFSTPINSLSAAVDVYADWVDACEEARLQQPVKERPQRKPDALTQHGYAGGARMTMIGNEEDDEDAEGEEVPEEEESDVDSLAGFGTSNKKQQKKDTRRSPVVNGSDDSDEEDTQRRRERIRKEKAARISKQAPIRSNDYDDDSD